MARLMTQPATRVLCQSTVQREVCTGQKLKTTPKSRRPFLHRGCACIPFSPVSRAIVRRVASCGSQFDLSFVQTPVTVHSVIDKAPSGRCPVDLRPRSCENVAKTRQKMPWANFGGKRGAQLQEGQRPGTERASGGVLSVDPHATCKADSHECLNSNGHECFFTSIFSVHALFLKTCSHRHANVHVYFVHIHFEPLHVTCTRRRTCTPISTFSSTSSPFLSRTGQDRAGQGRAWQDGTGRDGTGRDGTGRHGTA